MSDDVRSFVEQDKALCSQALDGDREVLIRAAEMLNWVDQQPTPEAADPT
jgi:hypothetical protein